MRKKLDGHCMPGIYLGEEGKGYGIFDPMTKKTFQASTVLFNEQSFGIDELLQTAKLIGAIPRNFDGEQLHILLRAGNYLIAARLEGQSPEETRSVIISPLGMRWLQIFFPEFMTNNPPTAGEERDTQAFLNRLFEAGVF